MFILPAENYYQGSHSSKNVDRLSILALHANDLILSLDLEIKKLLPLRVRWLFLYAQVIENGRTDIEVFILDGGLGLVALSRHINFVVGLF